MHLVKPIQTLYLISFTYSHHPDKQKCCLSFFHPTSQYYTSVCPDPCLYKKQKKKTWKSKAVRETRGGEESRLEDGGTELKTVGREAYPAC
jgi:hypothetical protein